MSVGESINRDMDSVVRKVLNLKPSFLDFLALPPTILLLLMLVPRRHWVVDMLSNFLHRILLVAVLIFISLLLRKNWRNAAYWVIPTAGFLILFGNLFLPSLMLGKTWNREVDPDHKKIRVMTFNSMGFYQTDYSSQIKLIRESGADIIALQELSGEGAKAFGENLKGEYPYQALYPLMMNGKGILSKYPFTGPYLLNINMDSPYFKQAWFDIDGTVVKVFNLHSAVPLTHQELSLRREAVLKIVELITHDSPVMLTGDFNFTDQASDYKLLAPTGLHDSFHECGWGFGSTYPTRFSSYNNFLPLIRIDYIFHSDDFYAEAIWTGGKTDSDHLPVIADLVLKK